MSLNRFLLTAADDHLLRDMCPSVARTLASTGWLGYQLVSDFNKRAYRINLFLRPFFTFTQYMSFRTIQTITGLLISGSSALQFMDRTVYAGSDLDLYVHYRSVRRVHDWLISIDYQFVVPSTFKSFDTMLQNFVLVEGIPLQTGPRMYIGSGILGVLKYVNRQGKKIDIIATLFNPLHAILGFHSTCVMNVISYAHAISLYPRATFVDRVAYHILSSKNRDNHAIAKYSARGWTMISRQEALSRPEFQTNRRIGDRYCWVIPLRSHETPLKNPRLDMVFANSWSVNMNGSKFMFACSLVHHKNHQRQRYCLGRSCDERDVKRMITVAKYLTHTTTENWNDLYFLCVMKLAVPSGHWERMVCHDAYQM